MPTATDINIDPVTFEILRHRMFAINDEAGTAIRSVSGAPAANEAYDFNVGLLNSEGDVFVLGIYIAQHALSLQHVVKFVVEEYRDNPGVYEGDMFLCNDPYVGALHQNDVACVAPIHWKGEIVAWTGAAIHQVDVGGPVKGSQCSLGADSIFQEAPPMPPVKIVENGNIRKDIKGQYLRRSRFPERLELDLRAKMAGNDVATRRIHELINQYGVETIKATIAAISNYTEARLRSRLMELPDGEWRHNSYLEYENEIYAVRLRMSKRNDGLHFDFTDSSKQARAVVNCTLPGLMGAVVQSVLTHLCYDVPWSPAGVMRVINVESRPGTVVHAAWPAGVSKASTGGCQGAVNTATICLSRMMLANEKYRDRAMAGWLGGFGVHELFGSDSQGRPFGAHILDSMVGGAGARTFKDGVDTGGMLNSLSCSKVNVETYEYRYPILYVYCRQQTDSGGAGKYRGGVGLSVLYVPHKVDKIEFSLMLSFVPDHPESVGVAGGLPSSTSSFAIKRGTDLKDWFAAGRLPGDFKDLKGQLEVVPGVYVTALNKWDVWLRNNSGGGGFGDPLDRDPALVRRDLLHGLVSDEEAYRTYGVRIDPISLQVDDIATKERRQAIRKERKSAFKPVSQAHEKTSRTTRHDAPFEGSVAVRKPRLDTEMTGRRIQDSITVVNAGGRLHQVCACGHDLGPANEHYKARTLVKEDRFPDAGLQVDPERERDRFVFRQFCCPGCARLFETEVALKDDPFLWEARLF